MKPILFLLLSICLCECRSRSSTQTDTKTTAAIPLCVEPATLPMMDGLSAPSFRTGIGSSRLSISTQNPIAQKWFDQGINLLHDFWHIEAYRAFQEVIKADSTCAMGYWGIAMCQPGFGGSDNTPWVNAIDKANALKKNTSLSEKAFIDAGNVLVKRGAAEAQAAFRNLYKTFPDDPEALAFAAIILRQYPDPNTQQEVKELLEKAIKRFPSHVGLLHYYVHVMELRPDFMKAKEAAEQMTKLAPNAPHLTHMPGHLYFLAGQYAQTVAVFNKARQQETAYHTAEKIPYTANQNYMHNLHYMAVAYSELGNKAKALEAAESYAHLTLQNDTPVNGSALMLLYEGRILPALVHIRFREFAQADEQLNFWLATPTAPLTNPLVRTYLEAMRAYCKGMAAIEKGLVPEATQYGGQLTQLMQTFEQLGLQKQQTAEFKNVNETYDILSMARYELAGWIDNINPALPFNASAWNQAIDLEKAIPYDEPPRLFYPIEESLVRLHRRRGDNTSARAAMKNALSRRPNSKMVKAI